MNKIPETLLDMTRIANIMNVLVQLSYAEGIIAEVGVYKGGVAHFLNKLSNGKKVLLFDTFEGIPVSGEHDTHVVGDFSDTNYDEIVKYFSEDENVKVVKGVFPESAKGVIAESDKFCLVHLDADQYESTLNSLKFFYNKMITGGVIICDDYNYLKSVDMAIAEFLKDKPEKEIKSANMQCYIIKQ